MHNLNFFNMRLIVCVGQFLWSEQTLLSTWKCSPEQNLQHAVRLAAGQGEDFLKALWWHVTGQAREWARLGLAVYPGMTTTNVAPCAQDSLGVSAPGILPDDIPGRVASFLFHVIEARFWAYAESQHRFPGAFAVWCDRETAHGFHKTKKTGTFLGRGLACRAEPEYFSRPLPAVGTSLLDEMAHMSAALQDAEPLQVPPHTSVEGVLPPRVLQVGRHKSH